MAPVGPGADSAETEPERILVRDRSGVGSARRAAREWAVSLGFDEVAADEICLVAMELGSNLVKHAGEGVVHVGSVGGERRGIRIESHDLGPGMIDPEAAFADGVSTAGSLGYGLGTVHRLMDEVEITSMPELERGTRVVCTRWLRKEQRSSGTLPLGLGVVARPKPGSAVNGDAYLIKRWDEQVLVAVIDGLGHGQFALRAATSARNYLERHYDVPLDRLFTGAHRACRGTRGVVMAAARIDLLEGSLKFASIGNIEGRLWGEQGPRTLVLRRGVVGLNARPPRVEQHEWGPESLLVLHSDGLGSHWSWSDFPLLAELRPMDAARQLFNHLAKGKDDAVVVVVNGRGEAADG